nr:adenine phosphoribosyltransferase [Leptinotarsa decemlineata]
MADFTEKIELIRKHLKSYPDFPKKGILFWDIFAVLQHPHVLAALKDVLIQTAREIQPPVECVTALDARGFLFGTLLALDLEVPFVPIRKKGKLPGNVVSIVSTKEYGEVSLFQAHSATAGRKA